MLGDLQQGSVVACFNAFNSSRWPAYKRQSCTPDHAAFATYGLKEVATLVEHFEGHLKRMGVEA